MSVKKQIPSPCKLYSFYEEILEEFLDETDVDSFFTTTFLTFPSPSIKKHELAEAPTKNRLQSSSFKFAL